MQTEEMRQAMSTLKAFSEKARAYHRYQARQNYLRQQQSIQTHMDALRVEAGRARAAEEQARAAEERERLEKEAALAAEEQERLEKEAALAEIERLKALLQN